MSMFSDIIELGRTKHAYQSHSPVLAGAVYRTRIDGNRVAPFLPDLPCPCAYGLRAPESITAAGGTGLLSRT